MKRIISGSLLILILVLILGLLVNNGYASPDVEIIRGAQLYDDWAKLISPAPTLTGNHPIWDRQDTATMSGVDTWRCVSCHGWDYKGNEGAFRSGPNYTGFPGIYAAREMDPSELEGTLAGVNDELHNFSPYLGESDLQAMVVFIQNGLIDDNEYIDPVSLKVLGGDLAQGQAIY